MPPREFSPEEVARLRILLNDPQFLDRRSVAYNAAMLYITNYLNDITHSDSPYRGNACRLNLHLLRHALIHEPYPLTGINNTTGQDAGEAGLRELRSCINNYLPRADGRPDLEPGALGVRNIKSTNFFIQYCGPVQSSQAPSQPGAAAAQAPYQRLLGAAAAARKMRDDIARDLGRNLGQSPSQLDIDNEFVRRSFDNLRSYQQILRDFNSLLNQQDPDLIAAKAQVIVYVGEICDRFKSQDPLGAASFVTPEMEGLRSQLQIVRGPMAHGMRHRDNDSLAPSISSILA